MKDLVKHLTIALEHEKIYVAETATNKIKCDIGGRTFEFKNIGENINIDMLSDKELAVVIAREMIDNRRENGISHEKLSYFKLILSEICHGIFYEGNVEIAYHQEFDTWMDEQAV